MRGSSTFRDLTVKLTGHIFPDIPRIHRSLTKKAKSSNSDAGPTNVLGSIFGFLI